MEMLGALFSTVVAIMQIDLTIFGFTFSLWQVFVFDIVVSILAWIIAEVFLG